MLGQIGKYEIIKELGHGGMATVYLAHHQEIDRHVAIKVLSEDRQNLKTVQERFKREARTIAKLEHKYILPIYDFDFDENLGKMYIVMRYLNGGSLSDDIQNGNLSFKAISVILYQVGSALDYAHRQGIVHRDLKPSNILKDEVGDCFLSDFGIAKHIAADLSTITGSDNVIGTPYYMSPEQCRGESDQLTPASDIYSLGVVLFEMLTGKPPYDGGTPLKTVHSHLQEPIPQIKDFRLDLGEEFQSVIDQAMAKNQKSDIQPAKS